MENVTRRGVGLFGEPCCNVETNMAPIRIVYLVLAVIGTILPWYYFASWFNVNGWDLGAMIDAWNVSDAGTGLVYDLTVAYAALVIWVIYESAQTRKWANAVLIPVVGFCVGVSLALPLYLFLRSANLGSDST